jgi:predicted nucleic acid-binding protein
VILLDTDIVTLLALGHDRVTARSLAAGDAVAASVVTRNEVKHFRVVPGLDVVNWAD